MFEGLADKIKNGGVPTTPKTTLPTKKTGGLFSDLAEKVRAKQAPAPTAALPPPETKVNLLNPLAIPKAPEKKIVTTEPFNNSMLRKDYVAPVPVPTLSEQPIKPVVAPRGAIDLAKRTIASTASQVADAAKFGLDYAAKRPAMLLNKLAGVPVLPENGFFADKIDAAVEKKYEQINQAGLNPVRNIQASVKNFSDKVNVNDPEWERAPLSEKLTTKLPETIYNIAPSIAGSLIPYLAGPEVGFAVSAGSVAEDVKDKALKSGVNPRRAEELGLVTGLAVGYIDKIVPSKQLEGAAKEEFTKGFLKRLAKTSFEEAGTEVAQENIQLAAEATFRDDLGWDEVKTRNAMSALGGLLGGAGINGAVDIAFKGGSDSFSGVLDVNTAKPKMNTEASPIAALDPAKMPDTLTAEQMQAFQLENAPKAELKPEAMPDTLTAEQVQAYQAEQVAKPVQAAPAVPQLKETVQAAEPKIELNDSPLHNKIMGELVSAEAGKRIMNGEGLDATFTGSKSTFPQWIPSELRRKPLLDAVSRHIMDGTMPTKAAEKRLYQVVYDEMNAQNDVLNDAKFIEQQRQNLFDPFASDEENAAALAKFDEEYAKLKASQSGIASESGTTVQGVGQPIQAQAATQETVNQPAATETITEQTKLVPRDEKMESAVFKRLQAEDPNIEGEAFYTRQDQKEQASKSIDLVAQDKNKAYRIAMGLEKAPQDLNSAWVNIILAEKAREEGNYKLYSELVVKRSLDATRAGQAIVAEKGSVSDNSLATYTKKLVAARLEKVAEKYTSGIEKQKARKKSSKSLAMEVIENQANDLGKRVSKAKEFNLAEVQSFIDSLAC